MDTFTLDPETHKCQNEFVRSFMKNMEQNQIPSETLRACLGEFDAKDTQKILWSRMDFISRGITTAHVVASRVGFGR